MDTRNISLASERIRSEAMRLADLKFESFARHKTPNEIITDKIAAQEALEALRVVAEFCRSRGEVIYRNWLLVFPLITELLRSDFIFSFAAASSSKEEDYVDMLITGPFCIIARKGQSKTTSVFINGKIKYALIELGRLADLTHEIGHCLASGEDFATLFGEVLPVEVLFPPGLTNVHAAKFALNEENMKFSIYNGV